MHKDIQLFTLDAIRHIPSDTGVYLFLRQNTPLYIGKAINIKARVASHLRGSLMDQKEKRIVDSTDSVGVIIVSSEFNALLLEAQLIKKHQPKYNLSIKDDKSYLYIKISRTDPYPKMLPVRRENDGKSLYIGPFQSSRIVSELLREIRKIIPFCTQKKITNARCFYSKIGLCDPCPNLINRTTAPIQKRAYSRRYKANVRKIILILTGRSNIVMNELTRTMKEKSKQGEYENALAIRNKLSMFRRLIAERSFQQEDDTQTIGFKGAELQAEWKTFMTYYFHKKQISSLIKIECFDISQLFGEGRSASMVVFINGHPSKKEYRRFKIRAEHSASDISMMQEVIRRRLRRIEWAYPDLIIVDGGRPQVEAALKVMAEYDVSIPLIGFAKKPDRIVFSRHLGAVTFPHPSALFTLFAYMRDESHRFAKKYHIHLRHRRLFS